MGAMVSVFATVVFFVLLLHAFVASRAANAISIYHINKIIISKNVLQARQLTLSASSLLTVLVGDALFGLPVEGQVVFQAPATPIMEGIIDLHHDIMFYLVFISIFVLYLLVAVVVLFSEKENDTRDTSAVSHHTVLEVI
jgi:hypothetical protein